MHGHKPEVFLVGEESINYFLEVVKRHDLALAGVLLNDAHYALRITDLIRSLNLQVGWVDHNDIAPSGTGEINRRQGVKEACILLFRSVLCRTPPVK
jgi:hypothetical protein